MSVIRAGRSVMARDFPFSLFQFPVYGTRRARRNDVNAKQTMVTA
jgi:hypothetical protein